jgi:hypothetical protein
MHAKDVIIGATYQAKVSNVVTTIKIDNKSRFGGWDATNLATGRVVRIKTAQRLRKLVSVPGSRPDLKQGEVKPTARGGAGSRTQTQQTREAVAKVTAYLLKVERNDMTLADALDQAIMYLGDFIYSGTDDGAMQDEVDQVIGRLSDFLHSGSK